MILIEKNIPQNCEIALIGDTHEGSAMCHKDGIDEMLDWVMAKRNRYFIHHGDEIDAVVTDDARYQYEPDEDPIPLRQAFAVVEQFKRAKTRGICWLSGNHPEKLKRFGNLTRDIVCRELGIPYGTWSCKLTLKSGGRQVYKHFMAHGYRGISSNAKDEEQRRANMKANLKMQLVRKTSDCLVSSVGHTHKLIVVPPAEKLIMADDGEKITQSYLGQGDGAAPYIEADRRWYVNTGSFLRMYGNMGTSGYAERAGYDPVELGYCVAVIRKGKLASIEPVFV